MGGQASWHRDPVEVPGDGRWREFEPGTTRVEFQPEPDGSLSLESLVGQAVGAASMCWENVAAAGVFRDDRASAVADALVVEVRRRAADPAWLSGGA
jgi:hypothetical protein